jgi:hypothetical protein
MAPESRQKIAMSGRWCRISSKLAMACTTQALASLKHLKDLTSVAGQIEVPDDFDQMGSDEVEQLFDGDL